MYFLKPSFQEDFESDFGSGLPEGDACYCCAVLACRHFSQARDTAISSIVNVSKVEEKVVAATRG
jgi:hypothetical protein